VERVTGIEPAWPAWKASGTRSRLSVKIGDELRTSVVDLDRCGPHLTRLYRPYGPASASLDGFPRTWLMGGAVWIERTCGATWMCPLNRIALWSHWAPVESPSSAPSQCLCGDGRRATCPRLERIRRPLGPCVEALLVKLRHELRGHLAKKSRSGAVSVSTTFTIALPNPKGCVLTFPARIAAMFAGTRSARCGRTAPTHSLDHTWYAAITPTFS